MSDVDDIWRDPMVKEALKERDASDIFLFVCPRCHNYGYWNQGTHWTCSKCDVDFLVISDDETPPVGVPVIYCGEEVALSDTVDFDDGPDGPG